MNSRLSEILTQLDQEHALALEWFVDHEGEVGPRPWRRDGKSVVPGVDIPLVAQRGIHQPSGWSHAISITVTHGSAYMDGKPTPLHDGTWVLPYRAHGGGDGSGIDSRWNRALLLNMVDRVPVGVFVHSKGSSYTNLGLSMVEDYYEDHQTFLLRGPVRYAQAVETWRGGATAWQPVELATEPIGEDERVPALVRRRKAQNRFRDALLQAYDGRCAITRYGAEPALQAAHILAYSGGSSQKVPNGILLRADIHLLYDRHLLSIDPAENRVWIAEDLRRTAYGSLHRKPFQMPRTAELCPNPERLAVHFAVSSALSG